MDGRGPQRESLALPEFHVLNQARPFFIHRVDKHSDVAKLNLVDPIAHVRLICPNIPV